MIWKHALAVTQWHTSLCFSNKETHKSWKQKKKTPNSQTFILKGVNIHSSLLIKWYPLVQNITLETVNKLLSSSTLLRCSVSVSTKLYFFPPAGFYSAARCGAERSGADGAAEVTIGHRLLLLPYKASTCGVKTSLKGPAGSFMLFCFSITYSHKKVFF